jgi:signal transduction histidine kinase
MSQEVTGAERLGSVRDDVIRQALQDVRMISYDLSPPALHELGLEPAVAWLARRLDERHGLRLKIEDDGSVKPLSRRARRVLFNAIRELLTNVASRPGADRATLRMTLRDKQLRVEIEDDGGALDPPDETGRAQTRLGLLNLNEQMMSLGGRMHLDSRPGRGTWVTLIVPLGEDDAAASES